MDYGGSQNERKRESDGRRKRKRKRESKNTILVLISFVQSRCAVMHLFSFFCCVSFFFKWQGARPARLGGDGGDN